jgi:hypothetical protein
VLDPQRDNLTGDGGSPPQGRQHAGCW